MALKTPVPATLIRHIEANRLKFLIVSILRMMILLENTSSHKILTNTPTTHDSDV